MKRVATSEHTVLKSSKTGLYCAKPVAKRLDSANAPRMSDWTRMVCSSRHRSAQIRRSKRYDREREYGEETGAERQQAGHEQWTIHLKH